MKIGTTLQQGDVLLKPINTLPTKLELLKTNVLQEGEHTGHAHRLVGEEGSFRVLQDTSTKKKYVEILTPTRITHEEHRSFLVDTGIYEIGIVQETDPFTKERRNVAD